MSDNKKYYYLRLKENFYESEEMIILQSMPDGYLYSDILLKLYLRSLKNDGKLMFNEKIPYNATMLAQVTRHSVGVVEKAMNLFEELSLIEVLDSGAIFITDIQNFIGKSSTEAERKKAHRKRIENEKKLLNTPNGQMSDKCPDKYPPEIEIEIELELDIEKELDKKEHTYVENTSDMHENEEQINLLDDEGDIKITKQPRERINHVEIINKFNATCTKTKQVTKITNDIRKSIRTALNEFSEAELFLAFEKANKSDFMTGGGNRGWVAEFDFIIKKKNIRRILDGQFDDKKPKTKMDQFKQSAENGAIAEFLKKTGGLQTNDE